MQEPKLLDASGGCLCGEVRYHIYSTSVDAGFCHCRMCQKSSGAPTIAWVTVVTEGFTYTRGEPALFQSSAQAQREFCGRCGTQLVFRQQRDPGLVDVTIATLDNPSLVQPEYHIWNSSRMEWLHLADQLPTYNDEGPDANA